MIHINRLRMALQFRGASRDTAEHVIASLKASVRIYISPEGDRNLEVIGGRPDVANHAGLDYLESIKLLTEINPITIDNLSIPAIIIYRDGTDGVIHSSLVDNIPVQKTIFDDFDETEAWFGGMRP